MWNALTSMHEEKDTLYIRDRDVQATNFSIILFSTTLIDPIVILGCVSVGVFTSSINYYQEFIIYIYRGEYPTSVYPV